MQALLELQRWMELSLWIHMAFRAKTIQMTEEMRQWLLLLLEFQPTVCKQLDRVTMQRGADLH